MGEVDACVSISKCSYSVIPTFDVDAYVGISKCSYSVIPTFDVDASVGISKCSYSFIPTFDVDAGVGISKCSYSFTTTFGVDVGAVPAIVRSTGFSAGGCCLHFPFLQQINTMKIIELMIMPTTTPAPAMIPIRKSDFVSSAPVYVVVTCDPVVVRHTKSQLSPQYPGSQLSVVVTRGSVVGHSV